MYEQKTVRVRVAVAVTDKGDWAARGWSTARDNQMRVVAIDDVLLGDDDSVVVHFVEVDVPVPMKPQTLTGEVGS